MNDTNTYFTHIYDIHTCVYMINLICTHSKTANITLNPIDVIWKKILLSCRSMGSFFKLGGYRFKEFSFLSPNAWQSNGCKLMAHVLAEEIAFFCTESTEIFSPSYKHQKIIENCLIEVQKQFHFWKKLYCMSTTVVNCQTCPNTFKAPFLCNDICIVCLYVHMS